MNKRKSLGIPNGWQKRYAHSASSRKDKPEKIPVGGDAPENRGQRPKENVPINQEELAFYQTHFSEGLENKNRRYEKQRHLERVKSMEEMYLSPKTAPEEILLQITPSGHEKSIDIALAEKVLAKQIQWEGERFPQLRYFSLSHPTAGSDGSNRFRVRRVWIAHDKSGCEIVSERKALREMGIERPDASKNEGRFNNAKMTYTAICREHLAQLCAGSGMEITIEPKKKNRQASRFAVHDSGTTRAEIDAIKQEIKALKETLNKLKAQIKQERRKARES